MAENQMCGHPVECIVSSAEGTSYCAWCEEVDDLKEIVLRMERRIEHLERRVHALGGSPV